MMPEIVLQQIVFLATASDSEIHPDAAVSQLEALVHALRELPPPERSAIDGGSGRYEPVGTPFPHGVACQSRTSGTNCTSMADVLAVSDVRNRWAEVFRQAVTERHPIAIERGGSERALLIGLDELERLIAAYEFRPEAYFEYEAVSIWLPELGLYGRGPAFEEAQDDLVAEVRDYVHEYLSDAPLYLRSPNRAEHFPFVMKAFVADAEDRLAAVVFASPGAVIAPAASS